MKPTTVFIPLIAFLLGIVLVDATSTHFGRGTQAGQVRTVPVLVARQRVNAWVEIKEPEKWFEVREFPEDAAPEKAIGTFEEVVGKRIKTFLGEGQPLCEEHLVTVLPEMGGELPPGLRAFALKLTKGDELHQAVKAGQAVDIIGKRHEPGKPDKVISNVMVVALDRGRLPVNEESATLTLALAIEDTVSVGMMQSLGMKLSIRPHAAEVPNP